MMCEAQKYVNNLKDYLRSFHEGFLVDQVASVPFLCYWLFQIVGKRSGPEICVRGILHGGGGREGGCASCRPGEDPWQGSVCRRGALNIRV